MTKALPIIIAIIAVGGISFYGGMKYQQGKAPNFQNLSPDQRQQFFQQGGAGANGARGARTGAIPNGARNGFNSVNGEIISKDDKSITVKLRDGGSQIVFLSGSTEIMKSISGSAGDLSVGQNVVASGQKNSDGSVNANTIQLRPALPTVSPLPSGN